VLGTPSAGDALHVFHRAWAFIAFSGLVASVLGLALGRVRARIAGEEPAVEALPVQAS
jgi:hypothetical protein